jgi:uncharacterized protein (DUF3820 family)
MSIDAPRPDPELLIQLVKMKMPFGKYKDVLLCNLPVSYLEWFQQKGSPKGKLGALLETIYEIKINGLAYLLEPLKNWYIPCDLRANTFVTLVLK